MRMVETELSVPRLRALLMSAISPVATWETIAIKISGMNAMTGLRKITSSRTRIRISVASRTIWSARLLDCWLSSCWAAEPVMPSVRPVPATSGLMSARSTLMASPASLPLPLTTLFGMATAAAWTRWLDEGGAAVIEMMFLTCLAVRAWTTDVTLAESAAPAGRARRTPRSRFRSDPAASRCHGAPCR